MGFKLITGIVSKKSGQECCHLCPLGYLLCGQREKPIRKAEETRRCEMPNWCSNSVSVSGPKEDVARFVAAAKGPAQSYLGPFNRNWSDKEEFDWGGFTPLMMEVLLNNPDTFKGGKEEVLSFHALYPVPKEVLLAPYDPNGLKKAAEQYPEWFSRFPNLIAGYDWENKNWGCKWGASDTYVSDDYRENGEDATICYSFDSAWSPPVMFIETISPLWPTLTFDMEYSEPGMCFAGQIVYLNGEVIHEEEREIEEDYEEEVEENMGVEEDEGICEGGE